MQPILTGIVSFFLAISAFTLPTTVVPKNLPAHDHPAQTLYITDSKSLPGTQYGYCGGWAVEVAERYLGNKTGEPTIEEWTAVTQELGVDPLTGGVSLQDLVHYYEARDFKITFAHWRKNSCDPQYYAATQLDNKCVVMLLMFPTENVGVPGHVETVVGVNKCETITNSWGVAGHVTMKNKYYHSNMTVYNTLKMEALYMVACK